MIDDIRVMTSRQGNGGAAGNLYRLYVPKLYHADFQYFKSAPLLLEPQSFSCEICTAIRDQP
jgi:hypothetical protein